MHSRLEHLRLTEKLFRDVIAELQQRAGKLEALHDEDEQAQDSEADEASCASRASIAALRLQICVYSLCLDRIRQQVDELEGTRNEQREHARDNFYRLMGALAQSELARSNHEKFLELSGRDIVDGSLTDAQLFATLEGSAERQLAGLIAP